MEYVKRSKQEGCEGEVSGLRMGRHVISACDTKIQCKV